MPVVPHALLTFSGVFGTPGAPLEEWVVGMRFTRPLGATPTVYAAEATRARDLWALHIAPAQPTNQHLTRTRVASVGSDGRIVVGPAGEFLQGDNVASVAGGSANSNPQPFSTALVVSLQSVRAGATGKGRVFTPFPAIPIGLNGRCDPTHIDSILGRWQAFVRALATVTSDSDPNTPDVGLGPLLVVSSRGYASPVTSLKCGTVPDTMRSRRGRLAEAYLSRPL